MRLKLTRPSPAMVVACLALFVALGSGAYAAVKLKPNSVKAKNIKRGAVTGPKIASNAVSTGKIAANAVTSPKLEDLSVNNAKIGLSAVAAGKLADDAVIASKIAPGAVTKAKFAASGLATNTGNFVLQNACTVATFTATGVQPGDVVAWSFRDVPTANGLLVLEAAENMVQTNALSFRVCEVNNAQATVNAGDMKVDYAAIR